MIDEREMPNKKENIFIQDIMILRNDLVRYSESVRARLASFPGAWRDIRLMLYLVRKIQALLLDTLPDNKVVQMQNIAMHGKFFIEMPGPIRKTRFVTLEESELTALMQAAMSNECVMCLREGKEIKRCPLRAALIAAAPPEKIIENPPLFSCEYRDIGCAIFRGENVEM